MIIDNNVLFSLMKPDSTASILLREFNLALIAPEFIKSEFTEHENECWAKSGLSKAAFAQRKRQVMSGLTFIKVEAYEAFLQKAVRAVSDVDDAPYLALALALKQPIWSNDQDLKRQSLVSVLSTEEVIKLFT